MKKVLQIHLTEAAVGTGRRVFLEPNWKRQERRALMFRVLGAGRGVGLASGVLECQHASCEDSLVRQS